MAECSRELLISCEQRVCFLVRSHYRKVNHLTELIQGGEMKERGGGRKWGEREGGSVTFREPDKHLRPCGAICPPWPKSPSQQLSAGFSLLFS